MCFKGIHTKDGIILLQLAIHFHQLKFKLLVNYANAVVMKTAN